MTEIWGRSPDELARAKAGMRKEMRAKRRKFSALCGSTAARTVVEPALELTCDIRAAVVAAYWPLSGEFDARPTIDALLAEGVTVALPRMRGAGRPLDFRRHDPATALVEGGFGCMEPPSTAPMVRPELILAPLLAFDRHGGRLGYGGGFYDRTLEAMAAAGEVSTVIALAFAGQEVERVPTGVADMRLDGALTENGLRLFASAA